MSSAGGLQLSRPPSSASRGASPSDADRAAVFDLRRINDELRREIEQLRSQVEAEKQRVRDAGREKTQAVKLIREQFEKEREHLIEITTQRVMRDKAATEVQPKTAKERDEQHVRQALKRKDDEMKQMKQHLTREREEAVRLARETAERRIRDEVEEAAASERAKLINELFALRVQKMKVEEQLEQRITSEQEKIALLRSSKEEHRAEIEELLRRTRRESTRDVQQLRLAERMLQAKDEELALYEYTTQQLTADKESLVGDLARLKTAESWEKRQPRAAPRKTPGTVELNLSFAGRSDSPVFDGKERDALLAKVSRLTAKVQSLEDRLGILKNENAQLSKRSKAGYSSASLSSDSDLERVPPVHEELMALRKRNDELETLNKQLQEKSKQGAEGRSSRQADMVRRSSSFQMKKQFSQQRAKERLDHRQELSQKDDELAKLQEKVHSVTRTGDDLQRKLHLISVEKLLSEKTMAVQIEVAVREVVDTLHDRDRELAALKQQHEELLSCYDELRKQHEQCSSCVIKPGVNNGYLSPTESTPPPFSNHSLSSSDTNISSLCSHRLEQWTGSNEVDLPFRMDIRSSLDVRLSRSSVQSHSSANFAGSRNLVCT